MTTSSNINISYNKVQKDQLIDLQLSHPRDYKSKFRNPKTAVKNYMNATKVMATLGSSWYRSAVGIPEERIGSSSGVFVFQK